MLDGQPRCELHAEKFTVGADALDGAGRRRSLAQRARRIRKNTHNTVKLTRRGRPVAVLLSIKEYEKLVHKNIGFWNALTNFRKQAGKHGISENDFEGLRDRSSGRSVDSF